MIDSSNLDVPGGGGAGNPEGFSPSAGPSAGGRHDDVEFHLEVEGCDAQWGIRSVSLAEGLNRVGAATVVAVYDGHLEARELLQKNCSLAISRTSQHRSYKGIIWHARTQEEQTGNLVATLHIVPAAELLTQIVDTRIYQQLTVPEIVQKIYEEHLGGRERTVRNQLEQTYESREYTVQYQESALAFISRLTEDEGIFWFFDHEDEHETLVLVDTVGGLATVCPDAGGEIPYHHDANQAPSGEAVVFANHIEEVGTTDAVVSDYDWTNPTLQVKSEQTGRGDHEPSLEIYDHTDALSFFGYRNPQYGGNTAQLQARLRAERFTLARQHWELGSTVVSASPGALIEVSGCPDASLDQRYLIVAASSRGQASEGRQGSWQNTLDVTPADLPYRPPRKTHRPLVQGLESAVVVGPAGEEIHTDEHGRIKVQFHWDRQGQNDEHSSCWLRVMQSWSGPGFGTKFLPRIGMEVLVGFMGGNPDRPLAMGCVYNGRNASPVTNPDDKTQSAIRTKSSPNSDGYNEIRFEDKAGGEFISLHAEKDFNEIVEHNHSTHVKNCQTNTVDANQTELVGGEQKMTVKKDRTKTIEKNEIVEVQEDRTEDVGGNETVTIVGQRHITVHGDEKIDTDGNRKMKVDKKLTEIVTEDRETTISGSDKLQVGGDKETKVSGKFETTTDGKFQIAQGGSEKILLDSKKTYVESGKEIELKTGNSDYSLKNDGNVKLTAATKVEIEVGSCKIEISTTKITLTAGASSIELGPSGVTTSGPKVTSSAQTMNEVTGLVVKIN